jgi:hypothetical protein
VTNPDVPPDGLLVQGDGTATPVAIAALAYKLPSRMVAHSLTLAIDASSAPVAQAASSKLEVCPLTSPKFTPAQGGAFEDAPKYNCKNHVIATPTKSATYNFSIGSLHLASPFGVAVVPTATASRVVLDEPTGKSLVTAKAAAKKAAGPTSTSTSSPAASPAPASGTSADSPPSGSNAGNPKITPPSGNSSIEQPQQQAQSPVVAPPSAAAPSTLAGQPVPATSTAGRSKVAIAAVLAMILVGGGLWLLAGSRPLESSEIS